MIAVHGSVDKLVPHLHLPVQSGSGRVLAAMKRGYTALEYKSIVRRLRAERPDLALTSDFIVGFPGETDAGFDQTMRLVADVRFDGAFSFSYSPRPGTPAAELDGQVPPAPQQARLEALQAALDAHYRDYSAAMVGTRQRVLVTGSAARSARELAARTANNRVVNFPGDAALVNRYVDVTITAAALVSAAYVAHVLRSVPSSGSSYPSIALISLAATLLLLTSSTAGLFRFPAIMRPVEYTKTIIAISLGVAVGLVALGVALRSLFAILLAWAVWWLVWSIVGARPAFSGR